MVTAKVKKRVKSDLYLQIRIVLGYCKTRIVFSACKCSTAAIRGTELNLAPVSHQGAIFSFTCSASLPGTSNDAADFG